MAATVRASPYGTAPPVDRDEDYENSLVRLRHLLLCLRRLTPVLRWGLVCV